MKYEDVKQSRASAATVARMKARDERDAARMGERGWVCLPPGEAPGAWTFVAQSAPVKELRVELEDDL